MSKIILIDNGHGQNTRGKCSPDKSLLEWKYAREIANKVQSKLKDLGYDVRLITPEETDISLSVRARRVNEICKQYGSQNCLLISIHNNAAGSDGRWHDAKGWAGYVYTKCSANSKKLANCLYDAAEEQGLKGRKPLPSQKYWTANFAIIKNTNCPAVLTENLFMDNKNEVEFLLSDAGKEAIADLHVNGIINYCND